MVLHLCFGALLAFNVESSYSQYLVWALGHPNLSRQGNKRMNQWQWWRRRRLSLWWRVQWSRPRRPSLRVPAVSRLYSQRVLARAAPPAATGRTFFRRRGGPACADHDGPGLPGHGGGWSFSRAGRLLSKPRTAVIVCGFLSWSLQKV